MVDLATVDDLAGLPGGPFSPEAVRAAGEIVRRMCGWHVAPSVTETILVDSPGGDVLWLPSRHVTDVATVRDMTGSDPVDLTGWRWSEAGLLSGRFPAGFRAVEVTLTHGYPSCPADLLPVVADRTRRRVMAESLGARSVTYGTESNHLLDSLAGYRLGPRS